MPALRVALTMPKKYSFRSSSLIVHIQELRKRLIRCFVIFLSFTMGFYLISDRILAYFTRPLVNLFPVTQGRRFIYTSMSEAFISYVKVSLFCGVLAALPYFSFQIWRFLKPALYKKEHMFYRVLCICIPLFFITGAAVAYYGVCPLAWKFFLSFENYVMVDVPLQCEPKIGEYVQTTLGLMNLFGWGFQMPVVISLLVSFGFFTVKQLQAGRRYAFLAITLIAAIFTPPDFLSPLLLIFPVYGLYELSLWFINISRQ